ncbi:hypothetical protein GCM10025859_26320 [Alicyclobacillus fastidiosus]|nr:hypothetical protein GCM10025859_26320 [Alicyclobacillus fastidiosus]
MYGLNKRDGTVIWDCDVYWKAVDTERPTALYRESTVKFSIKVYKPASQSQSTYPSHIFLSDSVNV